MWTNVPVIKYQRSMVTLRTIAMLMPIVPTLKDRSTARAIQDILVMESRVLVCQCKSRKLLILLFSLLL